MSTEPEKKADEATNKDAGQAAIEKLAERAKRPAPPPEVELSEVHFLKLKAGRLELQVAGQQMQLLQTSIQSLQNEMQHAQENVMRLRDAEVALEKEIGDDLGVEVPLSAYQLDNDSKKLVLPQRAMGPQRAVSPRPQ